MNDNSTDISARIQAATTRLVNAKITVSNIEHELDTLYAEVATLAPRRPRGRPRTVNVAEPAAPRAQKRRRNRAKPKPTPVAARSNGAAHAAS